MRVVIGADHAGYELKEHLRLFLEARDIRVLDVGAHKYDRDDDYPDFAEAVGRAVASGEDQRGILVCGSGVGACVAANKIRGVRACLCHDIYSAVQGVEHDDMNILCLGGLIVGRSLAEKLVTGFLGASFIGSGRYMRRLNKILKLEQEGGIPS